MNSSRSCQFMRMKNKLHHQLCCHLFADEKRLLARSIFSTLLVTGLLQKSPDNKYPIDTIAYQSWCTYYPIYPVSSGLLFSSAQIRRHSRLITSIRRFLHDHFWRLKTERTQGTTAYVMDEYLGSTLHIDNTTRPQTATPAPDLLQ